MTVRDAVKARMAKWPGISEDEGRVLVPTHCLYPSHGVVTVIVPPVGSASADSSIRLQVFSWCTSAWSGYSP